MLSADCPLLRTDISGLEALRLACDCGDPQCPWQREHEDCNCLAIHAPPGTRERLAGGTPSE
jgi:hypothetical protein